MDKQDFLSYQPAATAEGVSLTVFVAALYHRSLQSHEFENLLGEDDKRRLQR